MKVGTSILRWLATLVTAVVVVLALSVWAGCGPAATTSPGASSPPPAQSRSTDVDPSLCPHECFVSDGQCVYVPDEAEMRGDQVPVVTPEPCDPSCCPG